MKVGFVLNSKFLRVNQDLSTRKVAQGYDYPRRLEALRRLQARFLGNSRLYAAILVVVDL
jgi:hypothetical protein